MRIRNLSQINETKLSGISLLNISLKEKKSLRHSLAETMGKLSSYSTEKSKDLRRVIYGQYNATIHLLTETKNLRKLSILLSLKSVCDSTGEKKRMISNVLISNTVLLQGLFFYFLISRESELKSLPNTSLVVAQTAKHLPTMWETQVRFLGWEDPLEKAMAPHSSTLAWKIPRTEYPGRL